MVTSTYFILLPPAPFPSSTESLHETWECPVSEKLSRFQLSAIQIEVKSLKCESSSGREVIERGRKVMEEALSHGTKNDISGRIFSSSEHIRSRVARRHGYSKRASGYRVRLEDRLKVLERKISLVSQKRASFEKRVAYESQEYLSKRVRSLERIQSELSRRVSKVGEEVALVITSGESLNTRLIGSIRSLEETIEANRSETKRELARLGVNAARKAAELSLTREELGNLRRTVQALSVSASKLQERSDIQEDAIDRLNVSISTSSAKRHPKLLELEKNRYRSVVDNLPTICEDKNTVDGLRLVGADQGTPMLVSCREGSIVVGRRIDGTLDFDRTWEEYSIGFGSPGAEFWIGNELLHRLTRDNCSSLRINMLDVYGERWQAEYESFRIDSEETGYKLHVDEYRGNASDALSYHNGMAFSAKDRDLDVSRANCAGNYHGGWWFSHCQHANLNGKFSLGLTWLRSDTKDWMPINSAEMSIRRKPTCRRDSL